MKKPSHNYTLCEVRLPKRNRPRHAENLIEQGFRFKAMRQNVSLSRRATAKLLHISLRTLHNWESGKVQIPYAAYKLIRLFNSYEIFHPIWKDWRIVGSRLITPEGHSLEAGNFHWLSLMARRAEAFGKTYQKLGQLQAQAKPHIGAANAVSSGLVLSPTTFQLLTPESSKPKAFWGNQQLTSKPGRLQGKGKAQPPQVTPFPGSLPPTALQQDFGIQGGASC